jgi:dihydroorotate dehydrogenase (fumarate)
VKALMAGANAVQLVSALLRRGPGLIKELRTALDAWLDEHEYAALGTLVGNMNLDKVPDPSGYERANYIKLLQGWHT